MYYPVWLIASMKIIMKRIVTVIVVWVTFCLTAIISQDITTKAATKEELKQITYSIGKKEGLTGIYNKPVNVTKTKENKKKKNKKKSYTASELRYMTCIIYCEARGESYAGQKAVGIVVMNRKRSEEFPNKIKDVIYQRGQFSPVRNGSFARVLALYDKYDGEGKFKGEMPSCLKAAKEVLEGSTTIKKDGREKDMKKYLYFSRYISNAKYTLGDHQFK